MTDPALLDLFREEARTHAATLARGLLDLEADPANPARIDPLMRAAHSLKGAARILNLDAAVRLAHVMEDLFVAAGAGRVRVTPADVDALLRATDLLATLGELDAATAGTWSAANEPAVDALEPLLAARSRGEVVARQVPPERGPGFQARAVVPPPAWKPGPQEISPAPPPWEPPALPAEPLTLGGSHSMLDLFREEVRANALRLRAAFADGGCVDDAAESLRLVRGAALLVKLPAVEAVAAVMADAAAAGVTPEVREWLRFAVDAVAGCVGTDDETFPEWLAATTPTLGAAVEGLRAAPASGGRQPPDTFAPPTTPPSHQGADAPRSPEPTDAPAATEAEATPPPPDPVVRVSAGSLNRLMGLAGESLVQARWLPPFAAALLALKRKHDALAATLAAATASAADGRVAALLADAHTQLAACRDEFAARASSFDDHAARAEDLNGRLYREVIVSRMRPFGDGVHGLPRLVRDMARTLGKQARLVVDGETTDVDRDVLERLEAPLSHLVRNAVDHGLEATAERVRAGKPEVGTVRVEARHRAGVLVVSVADDGGGIDPARLARKVVDRGLSSPDLVARMTEAELLEFLFLPGFTTAGGVSEYSGRGVGLDVVQDVARKIGGSVRVTTKLGGGTTFLLQVPITLSVIRAVVVDIAGEPYAFPHTRIDRLIRVPRADVRSVEHRQFVTVDGQAVGLVLAAQVLGLGGPPPAGPDLLVVLLADAVGRYGLVIDGFRGEQDLVVRPLDPRLGKVPNLSAAAVLDDGSPVLLVDVEDLIRSTDPLVQAGTLRRAEAPRAGPGRRKRVLVVDDSITVREVERQLLRNKGYDVTVAVDGMDGWNQVRAAPFDLVVTDVDMPRMTGLQLVAAVRGLPALRDLPVVIVSYKERDDDRLRGLEAGANAYLTKSSFHDNSFVRAVEDLIGPAES